MTVSAIDNRIRTWFNEQDAVYITDAIFGDRILISGIDNIGVTGLTQYMILTGIVQDYRYNSMGEADDHDSPGITKHQSGYLGYAESMHATGSSWSRKGLALNSGYVGPRVLMSSGSDTYCRLYSPPTTADELFCFFRKGATNPRPQALRVSTDRGGSWAAAVDIFNVPSQRPYFLGCYDDLDPRTFHQFISVGNPNEAVNSLYYLQIRVANDGTITYWKSTGVQITDALPLVVANVEQVYDGTTNDGWPWDVRCYNGIPYLFYVVFTSSNAVHTYYRAILNNGSVTTSTIATGGSVATHGLTIGSPTYSGGLSGDPNDPDQCFLSRKMGTGNWQMFRYNFASGSWSESENISGDTGNYNCRPYAITDPNGKTYVIWWEADQYDDWLNDYDGGAVIWTNPEGKLPANSYSPIAKPASPVWQGGDYVPPGAVLYCPLQEGTGVPADFKPSGHTLSNVGTGLTWGSDSFGNYLTGGTAANHLSLGDVATINPTAQQTNMMWVMFSGTATGQQVLIGLGNGSTNTPAYALQINNSSAGTVSGFVRDDANTAISLSASGTTCNDGNIHVLLISTGQGYMRLFYDDAIVANNTNTLGTTTLNRFRVAALQRTGAATLPFSGKIYAFGAMVGDLPDPLAFIHDLKRGQFTAVRIQAASSTPRRLRRSRNAALLRM